MDKLFSKIYGCEAACAIGNSMGDVTEDFTWEEIEAKWGFVDSLLPQKKWNEREEKLEGKFRKMEFGYDFIYHAHERKPGCTEDGHERHRLLTNAILKKGGRITVSDLARTWLDDIKPENFGYLMGPQDQVIYYSLKAGVPPWEAGRYATYPSFIGTSKMILPIGCINACNPAQAAADAYDLGRIKDVRGQRFNYSLEICSGFAAACAEAFKPEATVTSIIDTCLSYLSIEAREEVQIQLDWAEKLKDWKKLRPLVHEKYRGRPISNAVEVCGGALALFYLADGNPKDAILYSVNFGRDTDCKAYFAGGLAAALQGVEKIPAEWVKTIEEEVVTNPWTVCTLSAREVAEGLYKAALNTAKEMQGVVKAIDQITAK